MHYAIGVGSNRGDRAATIDRAAALLEADPRQRILARSALLANPAFGGPPGQQDFLNGVWIVESSLGPHNLLQELARIEHQLGRCRSVHYGPRTIDLDLLLRSDGAIIDSAVLQLPHPRLHQRPFVLIPLAEVAGSWKHPSLHQTVAELLASCPASLS